MKALLLLTAIVLTACGANPDRGLTVNKSAKAAASKSTVTTTADASGLEYGSCQALAVYTGTDAAFAQQLQGASACPGVSNRAMVRVKMGSTFVFGTRVCVVPLGSSAFIPSCFGIDRQADLTLTTNQFTGVAIVKEDQLSAYMSFANGQSGTYPAMAFGTIR